MTATRSLLAISIAALVATCNAGCTTGTSAGDAGELDTGPSDASDADADTAGAEPVWPGTGTRYYPGIYPYYAARGPDNLTAAGVQAHWDAWFAGREDRYREFVGATPVTHLGVTIFVDPGMFFAADWRSAATQPYDWKGTCGRIAAAQDPSAAPGGQPLYDWAFWDSLLAQPFLAEGRGKLILKIQETYVDYSPLWMRNEGYLQQQPGGGGRWFSQMQDWAPVYMWQDIMAAFATRYRGDPRIASVNMDEVYPPLWQEQALCGNVHGLDANRAANAGLMEVMNAYLDVDPGMLWAIVNWYPAQTPVVDTWERGYDLGGGSRSLGANDLPGVQGHYRQDMKFFNGIGAGPPCSVDASPDSIWDDLYLAQHYAVNRAAPVFVSSEANGMGVLDGDRTGHRSGGQNPWNVDLWPPYWDPPGSLPNDDGNLFVSARFWVWYASGEPRASSDAAKDSGLGQPGVDPCGVIPANFYCMSVPEWQDPAHPAWTATNLSIQNWLDAFDTFGPNGTQAMFNHPPGYLE